VSTLHSSVFARLASGTFYETIVWVIFYAIINLIVLIDILTPIHFPQPFFFRLPRGQEANI
jgi:hypothetical protein